MRKIVRVEKLVKILDQREQVIRNKTISLVKVLWQYHNMEEAKCESEGEMRLKNPQLFE